MFVRVHEPRGWHTSAVDLVVNVDNDFLEGLAKASRNLKGLTELIWNSLDANATFVRVQVDENPIAGVDSVVLTDNGHGITYDEAQRYFGNLGGSWKALAETSRGGERRLHGANGQGRFRAFGLGDNIRWETVAEVDDQQQKLTIQGQRSALKRFTVSEPVEADQPTGTRVVIENIRPDHGLLADSAIDKLTIEFALYIEAYPHVEIKFRGRTLDPASVQASRAEYPLTSLDGPPADLVVIEWKTDMGRALHLCDEHGMSLSEMAPGIRAPGFNFTAYLRSALFREHANVVTLNEMSPELDPLISAAKDVLRDHFRDRDAEKRAELLEAWKAEQSYPYKGEPADEIEAAERKFFDIVAIKAAPAVNSSTDQIGRKFSLHLLRETLEQRPTALRHVLQEVLDLTDEKLAELDELLSMTGLPNIIESAKTIANRLDFLRGLQHLLFDPEMKKKLLERTQLHEMLANETWIFGEEYAVAANDEELTTVLKRHLKLIGGDEEVVVDEPVTRDDGSTARVDLMLSKAMSQAENKRRHLVVELKRPSVKIGYEELTQVERYAIAVASDPRFRDTDTRWDFIAVSNDFDDFVQERTRQASLPANCTFESENGSIRVWAYRWSQLIEEASHRLKFVKKSLDYQSTQESSVGHLRRTYDALLPPELGEAGEADPTLAEDQPIGSEVTIKDLAEEILGDHLPSASDGD